MYIFRIVEEMCNNDAHLCYDDLASEASCEHVSENREIEQILKCLASSLIANLEIVNQSMVPRPLNKHIKGPITPQCSKSNEHHAEYIAVLFADIGHGEYA